MATTKTKKRTNLKTGARKRTLAKRKAPVRSRARTTRAAR